MAAPDQSNLFLETGKMKRVLMTSLLCCLLGNGVFSTVADRLSVVEGDSVTLNTGVETNQQYTIRWYFNSTRIAQITGDLTFICTDVECNEDTERFRDRLKLDEQSGSLTIMNTRNTDAGDYKLRIIRKSDIQGKIFSVILLGIPGAETQDGVLVSATEGDPVTLNTYIKTNQQNDIKWYLNNVRIAEINGGFSYIFTDIKYDKDSERFRDRLKLDNETGSLTITNTRATDSGKYTLDITNNAFSIMRSFRVRITIANSAHSEEKPAVVSVLVVVAVVVVVVVAAVILFYKTRKSSRQNRNRSAEHQGQMNRLEPGCLDAG